MKKFQQFDAETLKVVSTSLFSRRRDFNVREIEALFNDKSIGYIAHALAIMPKTVHYDSYFCRNSAMLLADALRGVEKMLRDLEDSYQNPSDTDSKMTDDIFQAHRGILLRLKYQLEKRFRRADKLAILEQKAEEEGRRNKSHKKYGIYHRAD